MSAKHTPGPWTLNYRTSTFMSEPWFDGVVGPDGQHIKVEGLTLTRSDEAFANSRLIAAAPELLEALQMFLDDYESSEGDAQSCARAARAVIAKATGEQQ